MMTTTMTNDEIIRMARDAGGAGGVGFEIFVERFAALVAAHAKQEYIDSVYEQHRETMFSNKDLGMLVDAVKAEREVCAAICDRFAERDMHPAECAAAIRARGEK